MGVRRLFEVTGLRVCYHCVLYLLPVIHRTEAIAITTPSSSNDNEASEVEQLRRRTEDIGPTNKKSSEDDADMLKGLAAGFGFFFGLIILVCLVWCLCCANVCSKKDGIPEKRLKSKVSPSPPRSAATVRTRPMVTSSP